MKRLAALILGLAVLGCQPPTPAQEATAARIAIDSGRAACLVAQAKGLALTQAQSDWCACHK